TSDDEAVKSAVAAAYLHVVLAAEATAAEVALARAEWQAAVFAERPRRLALRELHPAWPLQPVRISVLRNHAVEPVLALSQPFLAYAGFDAQVVFSPYDDAMSAPPRLDADVHLVWLDPSRYASADGRSPADLLSARLRELRGALRGCMVLVDAPPALDAARDVSRALRVAAERMPDVHLFPYAGVTAPLGSDAIESRATTMGTHVSGGAALAAAQLLG